MDTMNIPDATENGDLHIAGPVEESGTIIFSGPIAECGSLTIANATEDGTLTIEGVRQ